MVETRLAPYLVSSQCAVNCCLHRSLSIANNVTGCRETAQACPKVTGSEAAAEDAAAGGAGGAGDGPIGEGYTVWVGRSSLRSDLDGR